MTRDRAELGIFITLKAPIKPMLQEAKVYGAYHFDLFDRAIPKIQIVTTESILDGSARLDVLMVSDVLKSANRRQNDDGKQIELELISG
ncbi:hypothetical protein [Chamaesiphon sp.]|uniref:hypothetical protein n=1 Tax=Chamaesiphon sp. TaxID=2814140 RepID=UPI0035946465